MPTLLSFSFFKIQTSILYFQELPYQLIPFSSVFKLFYLTGYNYSPLKNLCYFIPLPKKHSSSDHASASVSSLHLSSSLMSGFHPNMWQRQSTFAASTCSSYLCSLIVAPITLLKDSGKNDHLLPNSQTQWLPFNSLLFDPLCFSYSQQLSFSKINIPSWLLKTIHVFKKYLNIYYIPETELVNSDTRMGISCLTQGCQTILVKTYIGQKRIIILFAKYSQFKIPLRYYLSYPLWPPILWSLSRDAIATFAQN